ncbi:MAG: histidine--tRNA ligase, partial [Candidatus Binatia bacterium]
MKVTSVKGFRDVLPPEATRRRQLLRVSAALLEAYGFREMELPLLEKVELFRRSVGADSDIVEKEMYCFEDKDGSWLALRPEGTASLVRAYIESGMTRSHPEAKLYYLGPMFRRERPQKGRYRQFSQIGAECLGRNDAAADAETITLVADICEAAGMQDYRIEINSLGDSACRPAYRKALGAFARERVAKLCTDCRSRLERNPLRLLDCKSEACREAMADAPMMVDHLCDDCRMHHRRVLDLVSAQGLD